MSGESRWDRRPPPMVVEPVTLDGRLVRLEPLSLRHLDDL